MYTKLNRNGLLGVREREECNNAHLWASAFGFFADDLDCSFTLLQINPACLCQTGSQNERTQNGQTLTSDVDQFRDQDMEALAMANPMLRQIGSLNEGTGTENDQTLNSDVEHRLGRQTLLTRLVGIMWKMLWGAFEILVLLLSVFICFILTLDPVRTTQASLGRE